MLLQRLTAIHTHLLLLCMSRTLSSLALVDHQVAQEWGARADKELFFLAVEQTQIDFHLLYSEGRFQVVPKPSEKTTATFHFNSYQDFCAVLRKKMTLVEAINEGRLTIEGSLESALRLVRTLEKCFIYLFPAHVAKLLVTRYKRPSNLYLNRCKIFLPLPRSLKGATDA